MSDTQTILHEDPVVLILAGQSQATEEDLATEARQALIRSTGHPYGADYKNIARSDWPQHVTRKQALAAGLERYFTGQACPHGHISERTVGRKCCSACRKAAQKAYHHSERGRAALKAYHQSERGRAAQKAYHQSERGRATKKAYQQSERGRAAQKAYQQSERGTAAQKAYKQSERGRATKKAYKQSERGRATQKAYQQSERGRATQKAYHHSERGRAALKTYKQSERGTATDLSRTLGFEPPKSVVKAIHAQRILKRALKELKPKTK